MRLYLLSVDKVGYDEYISVLIRAKDAKAARKATTHFFKPHQGKVKLRIVRPHGKQKVIISSFNAG